MLHLNKKNQYWNGTENKKLTLQKNKESTGIPQPPSRCAYGINFKILRGLVLELSHSQTWVSTPPVRLPCRVMTIPHQPFAAEG